MNRPTMLDLRWLLLSLTLVMALHVSHLASWVSALIVAFGAWRYYIAAKRWELPSLWILLPITLLGSLGIMITYHGLFGRDASVALLALMLALKLMETRDLRDYMLLVFAGFFLTITAFLFNQSIVVGAFIVLPTVGLIGTLVGVSHPNGSLSWRFQSKLAGLLLAQGIPVMLALFFLFPRIPGPLWGVPQDAYRSMSGLSDHMEPGNISQLTLSGATAFRVQFNGAVPASNHLYWRGPVLWHFDGRAWRMSSQRLGIARESLSTVGAPTLYSVTLEPHNRNWLLMLDIPTTLPTEAVLSHDMQVLSREPVRTRIRYEGSSHFEYKLATTLSDRERELALQINDDENPKSQALAKEWARTAKSPDEIIQNALTMFRQQNFAYTLSPPLLSQQNPIDDFLFNSKRGFCEHYASSFTYLMRAAGLPARVVTGYQGGEVNPVGNYLIVRQSDAHAWSEVWLTGRGWVRVDPTAAVSPLRIESGIESALPQSDVTPLLARKDYPFLRKLYLNWDAMNNGWNQWVLGYDQQRQLDLLSRLTGSDLTWQDMVIALMVTVALFGLVISYFLLRDKRLKIDPLQRLYIEFLRKLERSGLKRQSHEGPQDFGKRAVQRLPAQASAIQQITEAYARLRYRSEASSQALGNFKHLVRTFRI